MATNGHKKRFSLDLGRQASRTAVSTSSVSLHPGGETSRRTTISGSNIPCNRSALFSLKNICNTQVFGGVSADCRPIAFKQIHIIPKVSHDKSQCTEKLFGLSSMDDSSRRSACLPSCGCEGVPTEILGNFSQLATILFQVPCLRPGSSSSSVFSHHEVSNIQAEGARNQCPQLLGRPHSLGQNTKSDQEGNRSSGGKPTEPGIFPQCKKI